jgi:hypothetical protein
MARGMTGYQKRFKIGCAVASIVNFLAGLIFDIAILLKNRVTGWRVGTLS